jgi:hypothetical protein
VIASGRHFVNRLGYLITDVPVPADTFVEALDDEGDEVRDND